MRLGQVCVTPDYALIPRAAQDAFLKACQEVYKSFYGDDPSESDSFARIVSEAHTMRIKRYLDDTKGKVVLGGQVDIQKKYVAPTVVRDVPVNDSLMEEYVLLIWLE
ncbi:hypothetical protein EIP86_000670 [Pleurotus ostreatoroseus]|nr:hypothetical protein EIP86_000670 [Pleurotus ostreatoroseus]